MHDTHAHTHTQHEEVGGLMRAKIQKRKPPVNSSSRLEGVCVHRQRQQVQLKAQMSDTVCVFVRVCLLNNPLLLKRRGKL